jgi:hypothetical protein
MATRIALFGLLAFGVSACTPEAPPEVAGVTSTPVFQLTDSAYERCLVLLECQKYNNRLQRTVERHHVRAASAAFHYALAAGR